MKKYYLLPLLMLMMVFNVGCSSLANKYTVSSENVKKLRDAGDSKVAVSSFTADPENASKINNLTIRGAGFVSPYNGTYQEYLQTALQDELSFSNRLDKNSQVIVSGIVLKNEFDGSGVNVGEASIAARIKVTRSGDVKYNKVVSTDYTWESYFAAFSAVPAAQIAYGRMIQKFLSELYSDKEFIDAIK